MRASKKSIALIISSCIFLLASCFLFLYISKLEQKEPHSDIDSKAYLERGGLFYATNRFVTLSSPQQPYYALGYALFIGVAYKIFGQSITIIIILQALLALLSCFLMMRIAQRFFGERAAVVTAILFAINIGYLTFTQFILTEILLSFFLVLFFERLTVVFQQQVRGNNALGKLCQAGFALGASIIVKPAALFFVFIVAVLLMLLLKTRRASRLGMAILFVLCFYIPVIGYMTYNSFAFGNFCVSTLDRVNLYYWFFPNVLAYEHHTTSDIERTKLLALSNGSHNFDAIDKLFWDTFKQKPLLFARVWLINVFKTLAGLYVTNLKVLVEPKVHGGAISFFKMPGGLMDKTWAYITAGSTTSWIVAIGLFEALWSVVRYLLCFLALGVLFRTNKIHWLLLSFAFIGYFSLITGHDGCARFRMMFEFLLIVLTSGGLTSIFSRPNS